MNARQRFLEKVAAPNSAGCTLWTGNLSRTGYGFFWLDGRNVHAHRAAQFLFVGEIPDGERVLHKCDVPACVNLKHLFLGSSQDNTDDMRAKGRMSKGQDAPLAKLSELDAIEVLRRYAAGETQVSLAAAFDVSSGTISSLVRGVSWKHLPRSRVAAQ